jgi:hypothetical protein
MRNEEMGKENVGCICSSMTIYTQLLLLFRKNLTRIHNCLNHFFAMSIEIFPLLMDLIGTEVRKKYTDVCTAVLAEEKLLPYHWMTAVKHFPTTS